MISSQVMWCLLKRNCSFVLCFHLTPVLWSKHNNFLNHDYINGLLCVQTIQVLLCLSCCYFGGQWLIIVTVMEHVMNHTHFSYPFNLKQIKRFYKLSLLFCLFVLNNELMWRKKDKFTCVWWFFYVKVRENPKLVSKLYFATDFINAFIPLHRNHTFQLIRILQCLGLTARWSSLIVF